MKSKSPKAILEKRFKECKNEPGYRLYHDCVEVKHVGPGCFEIWWTAGQYLCMLTFVPSLKKWGATHNMHPNENTKMFDDPLKAIYQYQRRGPRPLSEGS